jgi:multidrug resistance efflux pump
VRLVIDDPDPQYPLRAGMSVGVEVDTRYRRPLLVQVERGFARLTGAPDPGAVARR